MRCNIWKNQSCSISAQLRNGGLNLSQLAESVEDICRTPTHGMGSPFMWCSITGSNKGFNNIAAKLKQNIVCAPLRRNHHQNLHSFKSIQIK